MKLIVGIIKSLKVVAGSFGIALRTFRHGEVSEPVRTDRDVPMIAILSGIVIGALAVAAFLGQLPVSWTVVAVGLLMTLLFSFFFTSVAANAIATTARNPASKVAMWDSIRPA